MNDVTFSLCQINKQVLYLCLYHVNCVVFTNRKSELDYVYTLQVVKDKDLLANYDIFLLYLYVCLRYGTW